MEKKQKTINSKYEDKWVRGEKKGESYERRRDRKKWRGETIEDAKTEMKNEGRKGVRGKRTKSRGGKIKKSV